MPRVPLFDKEPVPGLAGLVGLSGPGPGDDVALVIDAVVLGAKGDGKTQFITHAIRTLDARGPSGLSPEEQLQNEKMVGLVLNAKRPQPEANPDRKVRHYVVRLRPDNLVAGLPVWARAALLLRAGRAGRYLVMVALALPLVLAGLRALRGELDWTAAAGVASAAMAGAAWAFAVARRDFARAGDVEVVFWDVAGEDVYSDRGAAAYHAFVAALTARRRAARARGGPSGYALAPILICNPLAVGRHADDSPYARLRMILPSFTALGRPHSDVLVVVNRWELAAKVCAAETEADECLAIVPIARDAPPVVDGGPRDPLPVVCRRVVLRHCLDGEPLAVGATRFRMVRYEAGLDTQAQAAPWSGYEALPAETRARWAGPGDGPIAGVIEYRYAEGPGVLAGEAAAGFFAWLAGLAWPWRPDRPEPELALEAFPEGTVKMFAPVAMPVAEEAPDKRAGFRSGT
jgi:hypothetical protein